MQTSELFCLSDTAVLIGKPEIIQRPKDMTFNADFDDQRSGIFLGTSKYFIDTISRKISQSNPKQKVLAILTDFEESSVENILKYSHKQFELTRLYITSYEDLKNGASVSIHTYDLVAYGQPTIRKFSIRTKLSRHFLTFNSKRYSNWNKNEMRISLHPFSLAAKIDLKTCDPKSLRYIDGEILKIFSQYFNFSMKLLINTKGGLGTKLPNGSLTGALEMIENGTVDLLASGRIFMNYNSQNISFIYPSRQMTYVFAFPKTSWKDVNILKKYLKSIHWKLCLFIFSVIIFVPLIMVVIQHYQNPLEKHRLTKNYQMIMSISLSVSTKLPKSWPLRWIVGSLLLPFVVISTLYASRMIAFFNDAKKDMQDINTIDELVKSGFEFTILDSLTSIFEENDKETAPESHILIHKMIQNEWKKKNNGDNEAFAANLTKVLLDRKTAVFVPMILMQELLGKFGDHITYIKQTPYSYFVTMTMRKQLPMLNGDFLLK